MREYLRINGHGHLLPEPHQIPQFMKDRKIFWVDSDRRFMRQGSWSRPITDRSFFLKEKLEWMEKNNIHHEVVLNLSQLYCNGFDESTCSDVIRFQNDFNASLQHWFPEKFTSGFVVQPKFIDQSLKEMERCVNDFGLKLMCLPTHFLNKDNEWLSVADDSVKPIFELANQLSLAIEIHPYDGEKIIALKDKFWRFHLVWMCALTADTYHMYTLLGFHKKYDNTRVCFAHGNQYGHMSYGRRRQGFKGRPDLFEDANHPDTALKAKNIFNDSIVHDPFALRLLIDRGGSHTIVAGLDDPYPLGEMETIADCYPGKVLDDALKLNFLSFQEFKNIWYKNVLDWLYGEGNHNNFHERTQLNQLIHEND